jgi:DNA polymerase III delta prime subunit
MQQKPPVRLLVFKGFPGVGKTTLSRAVAERLGAPRFDKDDFKDVLYSANILPEERCNELSKRLLYSLVAEQVQLGVPVVIVDAPFRFRSDLDAFISAIREKLRPSITMFRTNHQDSPKLVEILLINCKLRDENEWKRRIESRALELTPAEGHRPRTWEAVKKLRETSEMYLEADDGYWAEDHGESWRAYHPTDEIRILTHEIDMTTPALDTLLYWCCSSAVSETGASAD